MDIDRDQIDEAVLALLFLGRHDGMRTWKSFDWAAMERLHAKELIWTQSAKLNQSYSLTKACVSPKHYSESCSRSDAKHEARYPEFSLPAAQAPTPGAPPPLQRSMH